MSTTTAELTSATPEQLAAIEKKKTAWSNFGLALHQKETEWQLKASAALNRLKVPVNLEEVPECEKILAEVKREFKEIADDRLKLTSRLDEVKKRCIAPEQLGGPAYAPVEKAIISLKSEHERRQREQQQKEQAKQNLILQLKNSVAEQLAGFRKMMVDELNQIYKMAFAQDVKPADISKWMFTYKTRFNENHFQPTPADVAVTMSTLLSLNDFNEAKREHYIIDQSALVTEWQNALTEKFSDYEVAYNNREAAIERADQETIQATHQIETNKVNEQIAASVEAVSTPLTMEVVVPVKELKRSFEVEMQENWDSAAVVVAAFWANFAKIRPMLGRVSKPSAFNIGQMANYLGKLKTEDNAFTASGISFKEIEKL